MTLRYESMVACALAVVCGALLALAASTARADTPTPLASPSATATAAPQPFATDTPSPTPAAQPGTAATPTLTAEQPMVVRGAAWVDGRPADYHVPIVAYVGEIECGRSETFGSSPDAYFPSMMIDVVSAAARGGCGVVGATVRFTVGARDALPNVLWQPGEIVHGVELVVGAPFGRFVGTYSAVAGGEVVPIIGGKVCGKKLNPTQGVGPESYGFDIVVEAEAVTPGCGKPGALVTFRLNTNTGSFESLSGFEWQPGIDRRDLRVVFSDHIAALPAAGAGGHNTRNVMLATFAGAVLVCLVAVGMQRMHRR